MEAGVGACAGGEDETVPLPAAADVVFDAAESGEKLVGREKDRLVRQIGHAPSQQREIVHGQVLQGFKAQRLAFADHIRGLRQRVDRLPVGGVGGSGGLGVFFALAGFIEEKVAQRRQGIFRVDGQGAQRHGEKQRQGKQGLHHRFHRS